MRMRLKLLALASCCGIATAQETAVSISIAGDAAGPGTEAATRSFTWPTDGTLQSRLEALQNDQGPLSILERGFDLDEGQEERLRNLRQTMNEERRVAIEAIDQRLDVEYRGRAQEILAPDQRDVYAKVMDLLQAHADDIERGRAAYTNSMASVGVRNTTLLLDASRPDQVVYRLPNLTEEERLRIRQVTRDSNAKQNQEQQALLQAANISRPGARDRDAWRVYMVEREKIQQQVFANYRDQLALEIAGALEPERATQYEVLLQASESYETKRKESRTRLLEALTPLVGAERAERIAGDSNPIRRWLQNR